MIMKEGEEQEQEDIRKYNRRKLHRIILRFPSRDFLVRLQAVFYRFDLCRGEIRARESTSASPSGYVCCLEITSRLETADVARR